MPAFDRLMKAADPAMVVVTTAVGNERAGCLVGFHGQSSIEPERYSVWLSKANHTWRVGHRASWFAVHFLNARQLKLAECFGTQSGEAIDKFAEVAWRAGSGAVPLLDACPHRMVLRRMTILDDGGDHVCVTGEVVRSESPGELTPLRLSAVQHLQAGRRPDERIQRIG